MRKLRPNLRRSKAYFLELIDVSAPLVLTQAALALLQVADTLMVSGLGNSALAAIAPAGLTVFAVVVFGTGVLTPALTLIGRASGQRDRPRCRLLAKQGAWLAVGIGVAVIALLPTANQIFTLFGHAPQTARYEVAYFQVCLFCILPQLVGTAFANYFLGTLRPRIAMFGVLNSVLLNILLNYGLINGKFGLPEMGFVGAAWGTVAASIYYALMMFVLFLLDGRRHKSGPTTRSGPCPKTLRSMLRDGVPIGIQDSVEAISWGLLVVVLAGRFGDAHGAAASVLIRCMQLSFLPVEGVGLGLMTLVSNSVGAARYRQAKAQTRSAFRMAAIYMTSMALLFFLLRRPIMEIFTDDPQIIAIGSQAMLCVCLFQLFDAMAITHLYALFGAGDTAWPSLTNISLGLVVLLGGSLLLGSLFPGLESLGVWLAAAAYIIAQGILMRGRWVRGRWEGRAP